VPSLSSVTIGTAYIIFTPPGEGTPYNGPYGKALPERGTFFRVQMYKWVRISQAEVHGRVWKSVT